jgi:hypothetical protein
VKFEENLSNEAEKGLCSISKVDFVTDPSGPNLNRFYGVTGECDIKSFRKIPKTEIEPRKCFVLEVKCRLILTNFKQT